MLLLVVIAFLSGVVTILAPCIWPLLPLLLSVSAGEGKARPAGIVAGIITGFVFFTLFLAYLLAIFPISPDAFRIFATIVIILLGIVLLVPVLEKYVEGAVSRFSGMFGGMTSKRREGFWGGYVTGLLLGILWSPCAGPILAVVATLSATQEVTWQAFLITLAFGIGVGIPLFILSVASQNILSKIRGIGAHTGVIRRVLGVLMIVTALAILTNADKQLQSWVLDRFPGYGTTFQFLEDNTAVQQELDALRGRGGDGTSSFED